jgi:peptide/nickel transport system permease protein/oligopeptide transport system permease protein
VLSYIGRRLLLAVPTLAGSAALAFVMVRVLPGDPALLLAGPDATGDDIARLRHQLGTDQPLLVQFLGYLKGLLTGDLGRSINSQDPVTSEIMTRLPYTIELAVIGIVIASVAGIALGVLAAMRHKTWLDTAVSGVAVFGVSMPVFWLGLMLIVLFSIDVRWLPAGGIDDGGSWVLPSCTLAAATMGVIARITRSSMLEVMKLDFVRTARAKGAGRRTVVMRHALRNALLPVITVIGLQFGYLLGGAVLTETVFSWPGIGRLLVDSILTRDYPMIQGVVLIFSACFIGVNLVVDLCYAFIDPRIRYD